MQIIEWPCVTRDYKLPTQNCTYTHNTKKRIGLIDFILHKDASILLYYKNLSAAENDMK